MKRPPLVTPPEEVQNRFWSKVEFTDECWIWRAAIRETDGIGVFGIDGHVFYAHRIAYVVSRGQLPPGMDVRRTCRNPACVRPLHLILVPNASVNDNPSLIQ